MPKQKIRNLIELTSNMITLFDDSERNFTGLANHRENTYDYFNRSARNEISIIRNKLEEWFSQLPNDQKKEFKQRFKHSFDSVFYELFLFQLFKSLGFEITFHPEIAGTLKRPDFLIKKEGLEVYVEAKVAKDKSQAEEAEDNKINQFYDSFNTIKTSDFLLYIDTLRFKTNKQPNTKKLIKHIEHELGLLDPDEVYKRAMNDESEESLYIEYADDEIEIVVRPMPVVPSARGKLEGAIGMYPFGSFIGGAEESLQDSVNVKAKRYGVLDKPYVICVNALSIKSSSGIDIENAIWGTLSISFSNDPNNRDERYIRQPDGVFLNKKGARIKNVSGILMTRVSCSNIPNGSYWLFKHPFTDNYLDFDLLGLTYCYVDTNGRIVKNVGDNLDTILNIPKNWLEL